MALGADDTHKNECAAALLQSADCLFVDSKDQSLKFGDTFHAIKSKAISPDKAIELGVQLNENKAIDANLIVTDLTGIAAQDLAITEWVLKRIAERK